MPWGRPFGPWGGDCEDDEREQAPGINRSRKRGVTKSPKQRRKK